MIRYWREFIAAAIIFGPLLFFVLDIILFHSKYREAEVFLTSYQQSSNSVGITSNGKMVLTHNAESFSVLVKTDIGYETAKVDGDFFVNLKKGQRVELKSLFGRFTGIRYITIVNRILE